MTRKKTNPFAAAHHRYVNNAPMREIHWNNIPLRFRTKDGYDMKRIFGLGRAAKKGVRS